MFRDLLVFFSVSAFALSLYFQPLQFVLAQEADDPWRFPELHQFVSIREGATLEPVDWAAFISDLMEAQVVFLGESHDDDSTHRLQLALYQEMLARHDGRVILAMEMFERDVQPIIDDYLLGRIDETTFLSQARPWVNYREAYRPLVEQAKRVGSPVLASNFPRPLLRRFFQAENPGLEALGEQRGLAPQKLLENSDSYWRRVDNATRGHAAFMPAAMDRESRLMSTQSLWDNSMGESCAQSLEDKPDHRILHLNGGFHSQYWEGTVHQLRLRKPEAVIKTVAVQSAVNPFSAEWVGAPIADYVVFVESRVKNLNDGQWGVLTSQKVDFQLHMPESKSSSEKSPLLIWLAPDGLSASESLDYWRDILGDQAAIVTIAGPGRQQQFDLSIGGKWFWPDRFTEDIGVGIQVIERVWQYVLDRYPIDADRVCLAGEHEGATVCCAATLLSSKMAIRSVAVRPRQNTKLKDVPLPLLDDWGDLRPPKRELTVLDMPDRKLWWQQELEQYAQVGLVTAWLDQLADNPWSNDDQILTTVSDCLGLRTASDGNHHYEKKYVVSEYDSPKEVLWLRRLAGSMSDDSVRVAVVYRANSESLQADAEVLLNKDVERIGAAIPPCPGPFGGTTVVVLSDSQMSEFDAWKSLEQSDPLAARSRFHRLRLATESDGPLSLPKVVEKLLSENRKNLLIVPAEFYADPVRMRNLERTISPWSDQMTFHWLPGVGGSIQ
jgi:uncharacterized iron-regulated protein